MNPDRLKTTQHVVAELLSLAEDFYRHASVGPDDVISDIMRPEVEWWLREAQMLVAERHRAHDFVTSVLDLADPWLVREIPERLNYVARALSREAPGPEALPREASET